ncbi:FMN reductase [Streptomyces palmae]|uniref:Oxidoreductase n=1 Tax=Streptomyces palmae TaxID=1701085 RepID=A0A4Z0HJS2_9ACTN|nr:FMN reductase [Streptomyces palmae]TGB18784.1 oxidoreductase [Streptomyces palmae]
MKLTAVSAGLSTPSSTRLLADRLTESARDELATRGHAASIEVVELRELAGDVANHLVTGFPPPRLAAAIDTVTGSDGLIVVTPVFAASYSGLFKSFFDVIDPDALTGKPVLIAATGGTARHSLVLEHAMRPLFAYLRAATVPTAVYAASEDWGSGGDQHTDGLPARVRRAGAELAALMATRPTRAEPEDDVTALERQLADLRFD